MIKAKYTGIDIGETVESGRVYPISTECYKNSLIVSVRGIKLSYKNLEGFLKCWRIIAVYSKR